MSDNGEVEVENPVSSWPVLPKDVTAELGSIKLFNSASILPAYINTRRRQRLTHKVRMEL
jgi:hypothetical protein